jgi:hypothetical protein
MMIDVDEEGISEKQALDNQGNFLVPIFITTYFQNMKASNLTTTANSTLENIDARLKDDHFEVTQTLRSQDWEEEREAITQYWRDNNTITKIPKWRMRKQGGGDVAKEIDSKHETLIRFYRKHQLTATAMEDLLQMMRDDFELSSVPQSLYKLKQDEAKRFPPFTQYTFKDPITKMLLPTLDFLEITQRLLSDPLLFGQMTFDYNPSKVIEHPSNSIGWRQYSTFLELLDNHRQKKHLLLTPTFFLDEYKQLSHRNRKVMGIYFTLANLPKTVLNSTNHKYLLFHQKRT